MANRSSAPEEDKTGAPEQKQPTLPGELAAPAEVSPEKLMGEIESLKKALTEERARSEKYLTQMKYLQADFDTFQRRLKREIDLLIQSSNERLVTGLVDIIDELELAVKVGRGSLDTEAIVSGVEIVLRKLFETLGNEGLAPIEAVGKPLDPQKHHAVSTVETGRYPDGTIVKEIRRGYIFKGKVIKPSMVEVASSRSKENSNPRG